MGSWSHKVFACPYYQGDWPRKSDRRMQLHCEDGTRISFPDRCAFSGFVDALCASEGWTSCPIARMRNEFYERRDGRRKEGKK